MRSGPVHFREAEIILSRQKVLLPSLSLHTHI